MAKLIFLLATVLEITFWIASRGQNLDRRKWVAIVLVIPMVAFMLFVVLRIAFALLTGMTV